jgi:PIN domain nuclease of toxin-antitoxin system
VILLVDACALLWFLADDPKLSATAKAALEDPANKRWLSPISLMEIAIKVRTGRLTLPDPYPVMFPSRLIANGIHLLPLEVDHIEPLTTPPMYHKDPFDRLVAAIALVEGTTVVSPDTAFDDYGVSRLW